jgi:hypothetical protein
MEDSEMTMFPHVENDLFYREHLLRDAEEKAARYSSAGTLCGQIGSSNVAGPSTPCPMCAARIEHARELLVRAKRSA